MITILIILWCIGGLVAGFIHSMEDYEHYNRKQKAYKYFCYGPIVWIFLLIDFLIIEPLVWTVKQLLKPHKAFVRYLGRDKRNSYDPKEWSGYGSSERR